jgi:hypothetical protein
MSTPNHRRHFGALGAKATGIGGREGIFRSVGIWNVSRCRPRTFASQRNSMVSALTAVRSQSISTGSEAPNIKPE